MFADADVHYASDALERAVSWLEEERLDHLVLMPLLRSKSVLAEAVIGHFGGFFMSFFSPRRVNRGAPGAYVGVGAFNMVRRETFDRTEGWEWLRLEIADDVGLGYLMHRHGAKARFGLATMSLSVEWYSSVGSMVRGLEKNLFVVGAKARLHRALLCSVGMLIPPIAVAISVAAQWHELVVLTLMVLGISCGYGRLAGARLVAGALAPLGGPLIAWAMLRSAWRCSRSGEVAWRDTTYEIDDLIAGQRVSLMSSGSDQDASPPP